MDRPTELRTALADLMVDFDPPTAERIGSVLLRLGSALHGIAAEERSHGHRSAAIELFLHGADTGLPAVSPRQPTRHKRGRRFRFS